jgi:pyrophosphate--fructose-6-phosphate 1-phosphotransferase
VHLSQTETERLLAFFVEQELAFRKKHGTYKGSFSVISSFIGYQSRSAAPTNFDRTYAYNLGHAAVALIASDVDISGYIATIINLRCPVSEWTVSAVPITALLQKGLRRNGQSSTIQFVESSTPHTKRAKHSHHDVAVPKSEVKLTSPAYLELANHRSEWAAIDHYENPGPIQYTGACADSIPRTLALEPFDYLRDIETLQSALDEIREACRPGCKATVLHVATKNLEALMDIINIVQKK